MESVPTLDMKPLVVNSDFLYPDLGTLKDLTVDIGFYNFIKTH